MLLIMHASWNKYLLTYFFMRRMHCFVRLLIIGISDVLSQNFQTVDNWQFSKWKLICIYAHVHRHTHNYTPTVGARLNVQLSSSYLMSITICNHETRLWWAWCRFIGHVGFKARPVVSGVLRMQNPIWCDLLHNHFKAKIVISSQPRIPLCHILIQKSPLESV